MTSAPRSNPRASAPSVLERTKKMLTALLPGERRLLICMSVCRGVWTLCYAAYMSVNVSVRLDDALAERLRMRARAAGESLSERLRRYAEEGARREEHPLITFRDGPAGRRAGLLGGPDVWEVAMWLEDLAAEPDPVATLIEDSVLARPQIDAALRYRAAYPEEIAARIELHRRETASAETF